MPFLEVHVYATKGELMLHVVAVLESPVVAVIVLDSDAMFCGVLLKGPFGGNCFHGWIIDLEVDTV